MALNGSSMIQGPAFLHHTLFHTSTSAMKLCSLAMASHKELCKILYIRFLYYAMVTDRTRYQMISVYLRW